MTSDNIWLRGRTDELAALDSILLATKAVHGEHDTLVPVRGAGAPQQRLPPTFRSEDGNRETIT
jgi:hypothetical protein